MCLLSELGGLVAAPAIAYVAIQWDRIRWY